MSSLSSSAYGCYWYPHRHLHLHLPQIAAKSSIAKRKLVFSQAQKHEFTSETEVVYDGMDCLPNPKTPWLKLCPELDTKEGVIMDSFYSVAENRVVRLNRRDCLGVPATAKCFASTGEWLGFINPINDLQIYLANPFFSDMDMGVIRLPSLTSIPSCIGVRHDTETGNVMLKLVNYTDGPVETVTPELAASNITNLAISHSDPRHVDCIVAALQGHGIRRLAYSRIWDDHDPKTSLRWIGLQEDSPPFNIFSHTHKFFYTINNNGIEAFDLLNDSNKKKKGSFKRMCVFPNKVIRKELQNEFKQEQNTELKDLRQSTFTGGYDLNSKFYHRYHLVMLDEPGESSQLLLIVRHVVDIEGCDMVKTKHFDVFKVIFDRWRLVRLKTIGDYCLFVGGNNCFSLRASGMPGLHPNSIYFISTHPLESSKTWNLDRGIFNMGNNEIEPLRWDYYPEAPVHEGKFTSKNKLWCIEYEVFWVSPSNIIT